MGDALPRENIRRPEKALSARFVDTVTDPGKYFDGHGLGFIYPTYPPGTTLVNYQVDLLNEEITGYFEERHWAMTTDSVFPTVAQAARAVATALRQTVPVYSSVLASMLNPEVSQPVTTEDPEALQMGLFSDPETGDPEEEEIW